LAKGRINPCIRVSSFSKSTHHRGLATNSGIADHGGEPVIGVAIQMIQEFVVLSANPLDNIANTRKIFKVYLRGQEVDRAAMREKWQAGWKGLQ